MSLMLISMATAIVLVFHDLIEQYPTLAWLLPVIAAVVGNAGHQALAVTLRGIVLGEVRRERVMPLLTREATVGLLNGVALGIFIFVVLVLPIVPGHSWKLGVVAGMSIVVAMAVGTLAGASIPLAMRGLGIDPAQSSAIVLILVTDGVSFTTILLLAAVVLGQVPVVM
jgi:magnesium transporter